MSGSAGEWLVRVLVRIAGVAYPRWFRDEFGADLETTVVDRWRGASASGRLRAPLLARELAAIVTTGLRERVDGRPAPGGIGPDRASLVHGQDVRYALRLLSKSPLFSAMTVIVLSGGLGLAIFTFSFLHTAILKPLPLSGGGAVVRIESSDPERGGGTVDAAVLARIRPRIRSLSAIGVYDTRELVLGGDGGGQLLGATAAEWNLFAVSRTAPVFGRTLGPEDQVPGAPPVIVLSHWMWRVIFGGDSAIVGRRIMLDGTPTEVIGVMPEGFGFPVASEAWIPIGAELVAPSLDRGDRVAVYARLADGVSPRQVEAELDVLLARDRAGKPAEQVREARGVVVQSFPMAQFGGDGPMVLGILNAIAALILLLACINVTNLLLARANERARELAVRQALGASRARLVMQNLWESVILCLAGGILATGFAGFGLRGVNAWARAHLEGNLAFWWVWHLDGAAILAAGAFVTIAIAVLGGVVSVRAGAVEFHAALRDGDGRSGGQRQGRLARALVVTQVATVSVLMFVGVMAAVVARRITTSVAGFDTRNLLTTAVEFPDERYPTAARRLEYLDRVGELLARRSDLAGVSFRASIGDPAGETGMFETGDDRVGAAAAPRAFVRGIQGDPSPLGVAVLEGRLFDARDVPDGEPVAIVSRSLADREWPGRSPVGTRVRLTGIGERGTWRTVVGVVSDVPFGDPFSRNRSAAAIYLPLRQRDARVVTLLTRHRGDVGSSRAALRQTMLAVDPALMPASIRTYDEMVEKMTLIARSVTRLFTAAFGFALLLAITGTYGLMARSIGQRTREIGVRRALGASDGSILRLLLGHGGRQLGIGALVALPVTLLVGFGFTRFFAIGMGLAGAIAMLVSLAITAVVLLATYLPTRRAIAIEPRDALWRD